MSAQQEVAALLEQWLQLTREEAAAIESSDWNSVSQLNSRKSTLRQSLEEATRQCRDHGVDLDTFSTAFGRIISLLTRNGEVLAARFRQARDRRTSIQQNQRTLLRIQNSYSRPSLTRWHSFS